MPYCYFKMCQNSVIVLLVTVAILVNNCLSKDAVNNGSRVHKTRSLFPAGMDPSILDSVKTGTFLAFEHCQNVFHWDRWNCPKEEFDRQSSQHANKEAAFTQAVIAAGIVHSITKSCSRGEISDCGCDSKFEPTLSSSRYYQDLLLSSNRTIKSNGLLRKNTSDNEIKWSWGGCSDDVTFGARLVRDLLEDSEKNITVLSFVQRHNYRFGREIIRQTMIRKCRCHGVSGSCSLQTCWMQQTLFQNIAKKLKERYKKAKRLTSETVKKAIAIGNSIKREEKEKHFRVPETTLVYLEQSPDYCIANATEDWPGTKGRSCSRLKSKLASNSERKSCRTLCRQCGYKVRKEKRIVKKRCNCRFEWCCSVKCDICSEVVEELYCY